MLVLYKMFHQHSGKPLQIFMLHKIAILPMETVYSLQKEGQS